MEFNDPIYLDKGEEEELGIAFVDPPNAFQQNLEHAVERMAEEFGSVVTIPRIQYPRKGLLAQPLLPIQRINIESALAVPYAEKVASSQLRLQMIEIVENREPLVHLPSIFKDKKVELEYSERPFHDACGRWAREQRIWWLRETVAQRLREVIKAWNAINIKPQLQDAYRAPEVQEGLFMRRIVQVARDNPDWEWEDVNMVSRSLTAPAPDLAGHLAAAAADMTLMRKDASPDDSEAFLPLGNGYPDGGYISSIECPYITFDEFRTRVLFTAGLQMGGFRILPSENWHGNMGDRGLSPDKQKMKKAIYGPLVDFDPVTGRVEPYPSEEEMQAPFFRNKQIRFLIEHARENPDDNDYDAMRNMLAGVSM